jgi:putative membrane protein
MRSFLVTVAAVTTLALAGCSETMNTNNSNSAMTNTNQTASPARASSATLTQSDRAFFNEAATGGMAEVELGRLAAQKAQNPDVKRFGERMVTDHSKVNEELKQLAGRKGVTVPATPTAEQKEEMDRLAKLSGPAFDREYMKMMVEDHDKDVKAFQEQAANASDPDVKSFASKTLPTLEEHQKLAHDIAGKLK